jgi:hypothetical protein
LTALRAQVSHTIRGRRCGLREQIQLRAHVRQRRPELVSCVGGEALRSVQRHANALEQMPDGGAELIDFDHVLRRAEVGLAAGIDIDRRDPRTQAGERYDRSIYAPSAAETVNRTPACFVSSCSSATTAKICSCESGASPSRNTRSRAASDKRRSSASCSRNAPSELAATAAESAEIEAATATLRATRVTKLILRAMAA